ncbi:hypothetical protein GCM10009641_44560 [Mycobacterium cookii]|uniref:Colicin D C-terminal domain-containing protein n=1 Tax=Nocardioides furvisabuli TaxID=375542 RepID=A0ABP5JE82_9ACTN|nr:colicin D domain-containing protein [Nocardioides furvisabuli]
MRISVECGGYAEAARVCRTANHVAALLTESLAGKLGGYAAMAGDDATSSDFSAAYDPAAREAVGALADLTHALIGLGRLVDLSGRLHARAETDAAGTRTNAYTGGGLDAEAFLRVSPDPPPSSLGGSVATGLGEVHAWILDQVEGFVWPGADVDRLRDAADCWRLRSGSVADLTGHLDAISRLMAHQLSPEIPIALSAIADLRSLVEDTADQLLALADACDDYAAAVEDTRARTRSLLAEIGQMVVEEVALTAIVAGITGGLGGGVKAAAALARIRAQAPRFHALLSALRAVVAATASRLRTAEDRLVRARDGFGRFVRAPVRDERGEMVNPLGWGGRLTGTELQLQRKFKHAGDFGVDGPWNRDNAARFQTALVDFLHRKDVEVRIGTMRGQPGEVTFHYDATTRQCVMTTPTGAFISAWKLSPRQLHALIEKGHLGGQ